MKSEILLMEFKIKTPVAIDNKTMAKNIKGVMRDYHKTFEEINPDSFIKEDWEIFRCFFSFKVFLFEGSGKILITSGEVRISFFADKKFYWEKELREDFRRHITKRVDRAVKRIEIQSRKRPK